MILVTGGTGLVGHQLLARLIKQGESPRALFRTVAGRDWALEKMKKSLSEKDRQNLRNIQWYKADITDVPRLTKAFENISAVYHCAGFISFDIRDKNQLRKINIEGTANMVNLALEKGVEKFCHLSSA